MTLDDDTLIALGQIARPRGLSGELVIWPYQPDSRSFRRGLPVILQTGDESLETKIEFVRPAGKRLGMKFEKIDDRDTAAHFAGGELKCRLAELPKRKKGEFFVFDLVGLDVKDDDGNVVGKVKEIMSLPANDAIVIEYEDADIMIPMIKNAIETISLDEGFVQIRDIKSYVIS